MFASMKMILTLILLSTYTFTIAQSDMFSVVAYWEKGEVYTYNLVKAKKRVKGEVVESNQKDSLQVSFTILEENEDNYLVRYKIDSLYNDPTKKLAGYSAATELATAFVARIALDIEYVFRTSETGEFQEVVNWKEIAKKSNEFMDILMGKTEALSEEQLNGMKELIGNEAFIESQFIKDVGFIFDPFGYEYDPTDTSEYENLLPNNLGGSKPIKQTTVTHFENVSTEEETAWRFSSVGDIREKDVKDLLGDLFKKIGGDSDTKAMQQFIKNSKLQIKDVVIQEINTDFGIVNYGKMERNVDMKFDDTSMSQMELTEFKLLGYTTPE